MRLARQPDRQLLAEVVQRRLVEQARVPLGTEVDAFDEAAPGVVDQRRRPVLGEPAHDLGRGHERVVGTERLRRVTRRAAHRDATPVRALLADDHRQPRTRSAVGIWKPPGFGDDVVGAHRVAFVLEQVLGAPRAEVLLVGNREIDERAARA